jgi:hypothetical protein
LPIFPQVKTGNRFVEGTAEERFYPMAGGNTKTNSGNRRGRRSRRPAAERELTPASTLTGLVGRALDHALFLEVPGTVKELAALGLVPLNEPEDQPEEFEQRYISTFSAVPRRLRKIS